MGWFEVIITGLQVANTAANISVASNVNKMRQQNERAEQTAAQRAELFDLVDRINRRIRKIQPYLDRNPRAAIVLSKFYIHSLKLMGISPANVGPEDRPMLRDLNEIFEDLIEKSTAKLTDTEIQQANDCYDAIINLPELEKTINLKETFNRNKEAGDEAEQYLRSTEDLWNSIGKPAGNAKTKRSIGIALLVLAAVASCTVLPLIVTLPIQGMQLLKENILAGLLMTGFGVVLIMAYLAVIAGGILLIIKGKIPDEQKYKDLLGKRNEAIKSIRLRDAGVAIDQQYAYTSIRELKETHQKLDAKIASVLGNISEFNSLLSLGE